MRRSFGGSHGGRGGGGGNMLRTLSRTVTRTSTVQEPFSSSSSSSSSSTLNKTIRAPTSPRKSSKNLLSLSSPTASGAAAPFSPFVTSPTGHSFRRSSSFVCDDFDWICVDDGAVGCEDVFGGGGYDDFVLGPAPSRDEAQSAVSALQQVIETDPFSQIVRDKYGTSTEKDALSRAVSPTSFNHTDWTEPPWQLCDTRVLQSHRSGTVYDAFHLLQTDPSVQRTVISLSSDPAVWNAVLNNEAVQELKQAISPDVNSCTISSDTDSEGSEAATSILKWLLDNTKAKAMEIMEMINKLVGDLFQPLEDDKTSSTPSGSTAAFEEKLRYSLMLTVVVLLIVAVARTKRA